MNQDERELHADIQRVIDGVEPKERIVDVILAYLRAHRDEVLAEAFGGEPFDAVVCRSVGRVQPENVRTEIPCPKPTSC